MSSPSRSPKSARIARIQLFAVSTLSVAGIVNYMDRGSLAIANTTIRADLGISATRMGVLLSIFSMSYAISQLPMGVLLDRFGERIVLGLGMFLWSATQAATGLIGSFASFAAARIGLGIGEAPYVVGSVKAVNDWFNVRDRATPTGAFNSCTAFGQAIAPPILTVAMLAFGWRGMFVLIGIPGILLSFIWYAFYRDRKSVSLDEPERAYLDSGIPRSSAPHISLRQWFGLFRLRTMWGMMLGFGGINYTAWLYMSWMPNYLEAVHHVSVKATGMLAVIPFFFGGVGMALSGVVGDFLVRRGIPPIRAHRSILVFGMTCSGLSTLLVPYLSGATSAAFGIGMALFFIYFAGNSGWGLVQSIAPSSIVASVGAIQNFGSFVCASIAPIVTGWLLDRTHSFHLTLVICCTVTLLAALSYIFIVKDPIVVPD
jgi:MFS family permease